MPKILILVSLIIMIISIIRLTIFHEIKTVSAVDHKFPVVENSITYIGHATALIQIDSINIITDPMFSDFLSFIAKRHVEPGIKFENLPTINAILISHEHSDHLDKSTLEKFPKNTPVIISKGLGNKIKKLGFTDVQELAWWENTKIKNAVITAVPAKHILSKASGFVIEQNNKVVYFAGDTGLSEEFEKVGSKFNIDIALLPIGDYHPRLWFIPGFKKMTRERHMAPGDIPKAISMLKCKKVVPIHWGTFKISGTGLTEPIEWLEKIIEEEQLENKISILNHGETIKF